MRRAGNALLWIRVKEGLSWKQRLDPTKYTKNFFVDFLHKNWNRTQILVMNFDNQLHIPAPRSLGNSQAFCAGARDARRDVELCGPCCGT